LESPERSDDMTESGWFRNLTPKTVSRYVGQYLEDLTERQTEDELWLESGVLVPQRRRGYFDHETMMRLLRWKLEGSYGRFRNRKNTVERVESLTRGAFPMALQSDADALKILARSYAEGGMYGVSWSAASAILHWMVPDTGVILDQHALRAIWEDPCRLEATYTEYLVSAPLVRQKRDQLGCGLRDLDRALVVRGRYVKNDWEAKASQ